MRQLIVTAFVSADGVMEAPGGEPGYRNAGWTFQGIEFDPAAYEIKGREQEEAAALLLGRRSYEAFAPVWPTMTEETTSSTEAPTSSEATTTQAPATSVQQQTSPQQQAPTQAPAPSQDLSDIPFADGGTCPAAICGYGHDENGNPNPSSGEIQQWWANCTATNTAEYCRANDPYQ